MIKYLDYNNCYIAKIDNSIKVVSLVKIHKDDLYGNSYLLKDAYNSTYYTTDIDSIINRVTFYMTDDEIKAYIKKELNEFEMEEIITRIVSMERKRFCFDAKDSINKALKKTFS